MTKRFLVGFLILFTGCGARARQNILAAPTCQVICSAVVVTTSAVFGGTALGPMTFFGPGYGYFVGACIGAISVVMAAAADDNDHDAVAVDVPPPVAAAQEQLAGDWTSRGL
ncbi:hypothetical protein [Cardinium endosymbiont of Philonthus spinipes]|uniref:hypothetical protein n=1 Tax=Cardinium endosymbiont of Philonthus spinipes TaxID=3077941 RepID=UPI00313CDE02